MYTLKEVSIKDGYSKANDLKFRVEDDVSGKVKLVVVSGNAINRNIENNIVSLTLNTEEIDTPSFKLVKKMQKQIMF